MKFKRIHSDIGYDAISLRVTLEQDIEYKLEDLDDWLIDIQAQETMSLVFIGAVLENDEFLAWLTARLMAEGYNIVVKVDLVKLHEADSMIGVFAQRVAVEINSLFPKWAEVIDALDEGDIIYFRMNSFSALDAVVRSLETRQKFGKVHIFIDTDKINPNSLLKRDGSSKMWITSGEA